MNTRNQQIELNNTLTTMSPQEKAITFAIMAGVVMLMIALAFTR